MLGGMSGTCFTCKTRPAGYRAEPGSAYCEACDRPLREAARQRAVPGTSCRCAACGRLLATVTDFDRHQEHYPRGHPLEGVFTGRCLDPAGLGLELADGIWGTPEGNAKRSGFAAAMAAARARVGARSPAGAFPVVPGTPGPERASEGVADAS